MQRNGTHPMARINYAIRAGSFAYSFLVLSIHGWHHGFGAAFWIALVAQFLVYPHLAYLHAIRAASSRRAEAINLFTDAALLGVWIGALHFPLWLAYGAIFSTSLNAAVVFGLVRGAWSVAAFCMGAAVGLAFGGFEVLAETSPLVTALCFLGSLGYSAAIGGVVHKLRGQVRDSEAQYRLLAENAADLIAIVDRDGRWLYTSPSFEPVLPAGDRNAGGNAFERVHPDDADAGRNALLRAAATGKARELDLRLVDGQGRMRRYKAVVQPVKGEPKPAARLVLALRDVTDLHESEEKLLVTAHALEGMTEAIMITAADGTIVTVNRAFSHITGHARDDVMGQPEKMVRNALQTSDFFDSAYAAVHRDGHWSGTSWNRRKNGTVYREWRSIRAAKDAAGAITHYIHVFYEVGAPRSGMSALPQAGGAA
ncbi:MAG TPA: PAS domain S-box protein [Burkholderiales bacterium]|nr:PAS domain S-box protein [Burkholderiales bacterium]